MNDRWDAFLASRPVPLVDHLLEEVAKLIARDLSSWPPPVGEWDAQTGAGFATLFEPDAPAPHPGIYPEATRLACLSLQRDLEAYDESLRNRRYLEAGVPERDRTALLFLVRWLEEQMLSLGEATQGRIKRSQMVRCLKRAEALRRGGAILA